VVALPPYVPARGDLVWLAFDPSVGHEQAGRRPALTLSPLEYNRRVGLGIFCPITSLRKGYPFEVALPNGSPISGVVLSDQARSLDWVARRAEFAAAAARSVTDEVLRKLDPLLKGSFG
jgi:mRNA interferase MazF